MWTWFLIFGWIPVAGIYGLWHASRQRSNRRFLWRVLVAILEPLYIVVVVGPMEFWEIASPPRYPEQPGEKEKAVPRKLHKAA